MGGGTGRLGRARPAPGLLRVAAVLVALTGGPRASPAEIVVADLERLRGLKSLQQQILVGEAREEFEARARRLRAGEAARAAGSEWEGAAPAWPGGGPTLALLPPLAPAPDVPVSERRMDRRAFSCQSEVSMAVMQDQVLAAWNDGEANGGSGLGYGWSLDGGRTWEDGGSMPLAGGMLAWLTDPVVTVDERAGVFYLCGVGIAAGSRNAIGVARGVFNDSGFVWQGMTAARSVRDTLPDKAWIAADSLSGGVFLSYTSFFHHGKGLADQIEWQRSTDGGIQWTPPSVLSAPNELGLVQGSRPAVGPDGRVWVVWNSVDTVLANYGRDRLRVRCSQDGGATFGPARTAALPISNFGSGAPGYDRGYGFVFPGIAVDRSRGRQRGRVYLVWNEAVNFFVDVPGGLGRRLEVEPDGAPAAGSRFVVGETLAGSTEAAYDPDWYRFRGRRGQTALFHGDSIASDLDLTFRLVAPDGTTRLAYSRPAVVRERFFLYTLPEDGEYCLSVVPQNADTGGYRVRTGWHVPQDDRARDHRDVLVTWSDDGASWAAPVRVNDDPGWFDDWLPEVAVASDGTVWALWYDWRDSPEGSGGGVSGNFVACSRDGGATWRSAPISDVPTPWTQVSSNLVPNQGDYVSLVAGEERVLAAWADGRYGDPDVFAAPLDSPPLVALAGIHAEPERLVLEWYAPSAAGLRATVERWSGTPEWVALAAVSADVHGRAWFADSEVTRGALHGYRLRVHERAGDRLAGEAWIEIPPAAPAALAIERVWPNPAVRDVFVTFALVSGAAASLDLVDPAGRRIRRREVGVLGPGRHVVDLGEGAQLPPGLYFVRLLQGGAVATSKIAVVP